MAPDFKQRRSSIPKHLHASPNRQFASFLGCSMCRNDLTIFPCLYLCVSRTKQMQETNGSTYFPFSHPLPQSLINQEVIPFLLVIKGRCDLEVM